MESVTETWKAIPGYEGLYEASNHGRVRSLDRHMYHPVSKVTKYHGRILAERKHTQGYVRVQLKGKDAYIHHVVLAAFVGPNPPGLPDVNHIDGDKTNNRLENLEYCTRKKNMEHAVETGLLANQGERHVNSKYRDEQFREAYSLVANGMGRPEAARRTGLPLNLVHGLIQGKRAGFAKLEHRCFSVGHSK